MILAALIFSILSPFAIHISISPADGVKYLVSLDICNASASFVSADTDGPSLHECAFKPASFEFAVYLEPYSPSYVPAFYFSQLERPPRS